VLQYLAGQRRSVRDLLGFGLRKLGPVLLVSLYADLIIFLWSLALVVPGFIAACRLFVAVPARVAEPALASGKAVDRSTDLTEGHGWSIFAVMLVVWAIEWGSALGARALGNDLPSPIPAVLPWFVGAIVNGFSATAAGVAYHDLRIDKDGVDARELAAVFE
jgi:hypothetical protein